MIKTGVVGVCGRMGSMITRAALENPELAISGALEIPGHANLGRDLGDIIGAKPLDVIITDDKARAFEQAQVIIDFSAPQASMALLEYAAKAGKAMVIGTTGFSKEETGRIKEYSSSIPLVLSPNMSIGVNVMFKAVAMLTQLLGEEYDIEIVEAHHRLKKDAPSGTAKGLAQAVAQARNVSLDEHACYERHGIIGERPQGEIGIQTVRAGDIVGDHTVYFAGGGERIELTHRAHSRENFARGAVKAAAWAAGRKPGWYTMLDVLGI